MYLVSRNRFYGKTEVTFMEVYSHGDIQRITDGEKKKSESFISFFFLF